MSYLIRKTGHGRSILVNTITQIVVDSVEEKDEHKLSELEQLILKIKEKGKPQK